MRALGGGRVLVVIGFLRLSDPYSATYMGLPRISHLNRPNRRDLIEASLPYRQSSRT
jgi:hypothetical protein